MRYLARTSYDPQAMATFFHSLTDTHLEAQLGGQASIDPPSQMKMSSHPRTPERVQRAIAEANVPVANPVTNRDALLTAIDGVMFGADPREGVIKGAAVHPSRGCASPSPRPRASNSKHAQPGSRQGQQWSDGFRSARFTAQRLDGRVCRQ